MVAHLLLAFYFFIGGYFLPCSASTTASAPSSPLHIHDQQKTEHSNDLDESYLDHDPLEYFNRKVFAFNEVVDGVLIDPIANMYRMGVPDDVQILIANILHNASEPLTFINDCLQRQKNKSLESFSRFFINTVFGLFGIFDVAKSLGLDPHKEGFNTTLKHWGMPQGPYIVLPILGPANPRYIVGWTVDYFADPLRILGRRHEQDSWLHTRTTLQLIDARANVTEDVRNFRETSFDFYAAMRSFYKQYMDASRLEGERVHYTSPGLDDFMFEEDD